MKIKMKGKIIGLMIGMLVLVGVVILVSATMQYYTINVYEGWNLIPFGTLTTLSSADSIQLSNIKYSYIYDLDEKKYVLLIKNGEFTSDAKSRYNFNRGESHWLVFSSVWIFSDKSGTIRAGYEGMSKDYYSLKKGWNFKTTTPDMREKNFEEFKGNCNIKRYCGWERNNWECTSMEDLSNHVGPMIDQDSNIFHGIIIKVSEDCNLGVENSINPPAIPSDNLNLPNTNDCSDTDGGKDYNQRGYLEGKYADSLTGITRNERIRDNCLNGPDTSQSDFDYYKQIGIANDNDLNNLKLLLEGYCENGFIKIEKYSCLNNCLDGACIQ